MAWIEVHQTLLTHRKTLLLGDHLGIPDLYAASHLIALWTWAIDNAPEGFLPESDRIIAKAAQWEGDAEQLVNSLIDVGFLEQASEGDGYVIHDWMDYAGRLIEKRKANAERMRLARAGTVDDSATHVQRTNPARAGATVPYRTNTEPSKEIDDSKEREVARAQEQSPTPIRPVPKPKSVATTLPAGFTVTEEMRAWARATVPTVDVDKATSAWLDYCRSKGPKYADWLAAWRNGMRKAAEWQIGTTGKGGYANGQTARERSDDKIIQRGRELYGPGAFGGVEETDIPLLPRPRPNAT